jgi:hypothetical protein
MIGEAPRAGRREWIGLAVIASHACSTRWT